MGIVTNILRCYLLTLEKIAVKTGDEGDSWNNGLVQTAIVREKKVHAGRRSCRQMKGIQRFDSLVCPQFCEDSDGSWRIRQ